MYTLYICGSSQPYKLALINRRASNACFLFVGLFDKAPLLYVQENAPPPNTHSLHTSTTYCQCSLSTIFLNTLNTASTLTQRTSDTASCLLVSWMRPPTLCEGCVAFFVATSKQKRRAAHRRSYKYLSSLTHHTRMVSGL
jgi:hypothetical protein